MEKYSTKTSQKLNFNSADVNVIDPIKNNFNSTTE